MKLPKGFLAAGTNAGIKNRKPDCGLLLSERPARLAACVSSNRARAPNLDQIEAMRGREVRAVLAVSGNANALTGDAGRADERAAAGALATALNVGDEEVLTAFTGVIGHRPPTERIAAAVEKNLQNLEEEPVGFAQSILTTDRCTKMAMREMFVHGTRIRVHAVAKGSGMVQPGLATMLAFVTTDAVVASDLLDDALRGAVDATFNQLTVDGEMSTNDAVILMANGAAENEPLEDGAAFEALLIDLFTELAIAIAKDGEGATRFLEVRVEEADSLETARGISRAIAGSLLVKTAVFGADPNAGARMMASAGAAAARLDAKFELGACRLTIQDQLTVKAGVRVDTPHLRHLMTEPEIRAVLRLGTGDQGAVAWGCDLSYDYVKINADYAAITQAAEDGSVSVEERLAGLGPTIKKKILIEALQYIDRFRGIRAVIVAHQIPEGFAEDVLLLRSCGLRPILIAPREVVPALNRSGSHAVSVSDRGGFDLSLIDLLEENGYIPVVHDLRSPAEVAIAAGARKLIFMTGVPGILAADGGLLTELSAEQTQRLLADGAAEGLASEVAAALEAMAGGVRRIHLVDGRVVHNLIAELFTDRGVGTLIRRD